MRTHVFRGLEGVRVFAAWDARRGTFTALGRDGNDTILWQIGQRDRSLPTIADLRRELLPHRAFLTILIAAALLGDQESAPASVLADSTGSR